MIGEAEAAAALRAAADRLHALGPEPLLVAMVVTVAKIIRALAPDPAVVLALDLDPAVAAAVAVAVEKQELP